MGGKQTTDMAQWELIAEQIRRVSAEHSALMRLLSGNVPKSVWNDQYMRLEGAETTLRSELERRVASEHPDEWDTDIFYGGSDVYDEVSERADEAAASVATDLRTAVVHAVEEEGGGQAYDFEDAVSERLGRSVKQVEILQTLVDGEERAIFTRDGKHGPWRGCGCTEWK